MQIFAVFIEQTAIKIAYYAYSGHTCSLILSPVKQGIQLHCLRMWRHRSSHNNFYS